MTFFGWKIKFKVFFPRKKLNSKKPLLQLILDFNILREIESNKFIKISKKNSFNVYLTIKVFNKKNINMKK